MAVKVDFHTHTEASPDGSLTAHDYANAFGSGLLDCAAVTDHNTISKALELKAEHGDRIIVGEEITTQTGEVIGLFLTEPVAPMMTLTDTITQIKKQGGVVYIPHPFETVRKGLAVSDLEVIAKHVDIVEAYNGRAVFQDKGAAALEWARKHSIPVAASSDSHGRSGWGRTYTVLAALPGRENILELLKDAQHSHAWPGVRGVLYPKINRLRKTGRSHA
jgi:predicted metal-dependent phosphoesterase TrpH